jgi:hypothetical protein
MLQELVASATKLQMFLTDCAPQSQERMESVLHHILEMLQRMCYKCPPPPPSSPTSSPTPSNVIDMPTATSNWSCL